MKNLCKHLLIILGLSIGMWSCDNIPDVITPVISESSLDEVVLDEMARQNIQGMAVGVIQNGEIVYTKAYGHLDEERSRPVTTGTQFHWASISKTVTAIATIRAVTDGHLLLDDKAVDHVSYWPSTGDKDKITVDHLLSHRSGINHYGQYKYDDDGDGSTDRTVTLCSPNINDYSPSNNWNAEEAVDFFKDCDLGAYPNVSYNYSTYGYSLLGAIVEEATNTPFETYVEQKIANVAGMSSFTAFGNGQDGFNFDCNRAMQTTHEEDTEYKIPGGGFASNIVDLARFTEGLINNDFIPLTGALWIGVPGNDAYDYRKGVFLDYYKGSTVYINHGGDNSSVETYMGFFPGDKNGVCFMTNADSYISKDDIAERILNLMGYDWSVSDLPVDDCGDDNDCGHTVTGLWRDTGEANETLLRRGLGNDDFREEWIFLSDAGYHLVDIETYFKGTVRKWDGIFKKGNPGIALWRGLTHDDWLDKYNEMIADGYRLIDLETYKDGTVRKWAGVFMQSSDQAAMFRGLNSSDFGDKHQELKDQGYQLIDVETYLTGVNRKWAGVWKGSGTALLNRGYTQQDFKDLRNEREQNGYKLVDIETYVDGAVRKWAGVWEGASGDEHFRLDRKGCELITDLHNDYKKDGYELLDLEKY